MSKTLRKALSYVPTYVVWILATIFTVVPVWWMIVVSARSRVELFNAPTLIINSFFTQNYTNVITDRTFQGYMVNSLIVSTGNALLVTLLALLATYALSRYKLSGSDNIFFWTITNRMAPPAAFLLPLFLMFTQVTNVKLGSLNFTLYDTHFGLIMLYCVFNLPFAIWLMKGIMDGIPIEMDEAAFVDGATTFGVIRMIILPLAAPGLAVTAILSWIFAWNEYLFAATLTSFRARTITTGLAEFVTVTGTNWGEMAAVATLTLIPSLIFITFAQRYIVMGLTFGAVKD
ncbi:MAG: carbohydrate ABC transporter permease [Anaerolineae bacterium]|jgi:multiple sugar transport system permease protein|nr:carbohydrate ABC transporter permease [Chloroflexota bacterium]MBN8639692.1 carbohydrate ABC transporter permease [Anaerolineae bacterium]